MSHAEFAKKNDMLFRLCNRWLYLKMKGKKISDYLEKEKIKKVAIYGCGEIGKRLLEELDGTNIKVLIGLDVDALHVDAPIEVMNPTAENVEIWKDADALLVTPVYYYNDIFRMARGFGYKNRILALDDILMNM